MSWSKMADPAVGDEGDNEVEGLCLKSEFAMRFQ